MVTPKSQLLAFMRFLRDWFYSWLDQTEDRELLEIWLSNIGAMQAAARRKLKSLLDSAK